MISSVRSLLHKVRPSTPRGLAPIRSGPARGLVFDPGTGPNNFTSGRYEKYLQQWFKRTLKPGDVLYDVGANLGFFTILGARLVGPQGAVHAFEPVPANAQLVRSNASANGMTHISVHELAVSDCSGTMTLRLAQHPGGATLAIAGTPPDHAGDIEVSTVSLDELLSRGQIAPPDVMKVDVEGAEMEVLRGSQKLVEEHRPTIVCEFDDADEQAVQRKLKAFEEWMHDRGYATGLVRDPQEIGGWWLVHTWAVCRNNLPH